ncbi:MAG: carbohydrate kinase [Lachnospiraceae bacterium]|nr:carbohydrate kinase [Lachnospiraceae bacterium]
MEKEVDIVALGELLIDFTEAGISKGGQKLFEQNPGGAPANLLTAASHMGYKTAFVGKVGKDMHGAFLKQTLEQEGICTDYIIEDEECFTTLAFVEINSSGEREFSFARKPGADTRLRKEELNRDLLESCKVFHYGSLSLTDEPARSATLEAIRIAKAAGALISYDPNYRASLWKDVTTAVETMKSVISYADIMKVSDEESLLLTGETEYPKALEALLNMGPRLAAITLGREGVLLGIRDRFEIVPGYLVKTVDTTGAGDSFWGGFLSALLRQDDKLENRSWDNLKECARFGNAVAALCVQKRGGIPAIPRKTAIEELYHG